MANLYLVGTNHWDFKGPERLKKFLGFVKPSVIGLEASEELIKAKLLDRQIIKAEMEKQKQFDAIMSKMYADLRIATPKDKNQTSLDLLSVQGYEIWVPYEHQKEENPDSQIYPIHAHKILIRATEMYRQGFKEENIDSNGNFTNSFLDNVDKMGSKEFQDWINRSYFDSDKISEVSEYSKDIEDFLSFIKNCDDVMEPKIRSIISQNNGVSSTAIIAGNYHFFSDYGNNLYERLKDLFPIRIRLPEIDNF